MASRRKVYNPKERLRKARQLYAAFIAELLDGTVTATKLIESEDGKGRLRITYDDPNG